MTMLNNRAPPSLIGGVLLVIGNVIGAGILALPIATAQLGLFLAVTVLLLAWLLMMLGAYYFLETNLALPAGANLVSMSRMAFGKTGVIIAWCCNLLVMYSLIAAYLSGGSDLIRFNLQSIGITVPNWAATLCFLWAFGWIISRGVSLTDHTNRVFMLIKAVIFLIVIAGLAMHVNFSNLIVTSAPHIAPSLIVIVLTSFGFAVLVPSLRSYYQSDIKKIKKIIFWGTFVPFVCYLLWTILIFSALPYEGQNGLKGLAMSTHPVSDLQVALSSSLQLTWIIQATNLFSSICIITSFLANSISLTDFIADGLHLDKNNQKKWLVYCIAYLPALCAVLFYPKAFIAGLSVAGTLAIIQLLILPAGIAWSLRYSSKKIILPYSVSGGKALLLFLLITSVILLFLTIVY